MSDAKPSKEAMIIRLADAGMSYRALCVQLGVGLHRLNNTVINKREHAVLADTEAMMDIRLSMRSESDSTAIQKLCRGD
jgi:hypothetical protein